MAWIEIMPGVYAGVPDEVQVKAEVRHRRPVLRHESWTGGSRRWSTSSELA